MLFIPLKIKELTLIRNEISEDDFLTIKKHYNRIASFQKFWIQRYIFNAILCGNKYMYALLSSTLIGFAVDVLMDIRMKDSLDPIQTINSAILFILSITFAFAMILFFSKTNQIQESASDYIPDPKFPLKYEYIKIAQKNIAYLNCYNNLKYLKTTFLLCFISGIATLVSIIFGTQIVNLIKECYVCVINCLSNK